MEAKICTKCNETKSLNDFYKGKRYKDGLQVHCKECQKSTAKQWVNINLDKHKTNLSNYFINNNHKLKENMKQYHHSKKDGKYHVYLLPEVNYVGVTGNIYDRMNHHVKDNNITTFNNFQILFSFDNKKLALIEEEKLHNKGYKGKKGTVNKNLLTYHN